MKIFNTSIKDPLEMYNKYENTGIVQMILNKDINNKKLSYEIREQLFAKYRELKALV